MKHIEALLSGTVDRPRQGARLVAPDGTQTNIPAALYSVLLRAATALAHGDGIAVIPYGALLTTQQAADILNVSRPTFVKLLEDGAIPFTRVRSHRRVRLADLLRYQQQRRAIANAARARGVARAQELGVYDDYSPVVIERSDDRTEPVID